MAESLDMIYRFMALDGGAAAAFTGLSERARVAATATGDLTAATLRAADAEKLAADATSRAAAIRLQASAAMARAKELEVNGDKASAVAAREAADALALQARAAAATSRELNANAVAAERQAAVIRSARAETSLSATSLHGLFGQASGLTSSMEGIPTPVTMVAGALGKLAIGAGIAGAAIAALSIHAAEKFQTVMTRLHTQANVSTGDVAVLSKGILNMAASVATAPTILGDAAYHIASVGQNSLTAAQQLQVLRVAAEGAKIGGADLVDVTNALDAALVANVKGVHDYSQTMGVLNATVGAGDMSMQDLADAFGPLGSTFKAYNVTIQQAGAALAVFGDNNLRGALAGSQLRMAIQALTKPVASAKDALAELGLTGVNATQHFATELQHGGLTAALDDLHRRLVDSGHTGSKMGEVLVNAFGRKAGIGLTTLVEQLNRFHGKLGEVSKDGSQFSSSWQAYTKTFQYNMDSAKAAITKVEIELGNRLLPIATKVLHWIATDGVKYLDEFGAWFERNKGTISAFARFGILAFKALADAALLWAKMTLDAAAAAFGWVPGIGGKLKGAAAAFDTFYNGMNSTLDKMANTAASLGEQTGTNLGAGVIAGIAGITPKVMASAKALGGYAGKSVLMGAQVSSPSKITIFVGKMIAEGLIHGWTGEAGRLKNILGTDVENALNALTSRALHALDKQKALLKTAQANLHRDLASRRSDTASLAGSIAGSADLSGAFTQDAAGNTVLGNVGTFAAGQVGPLKQFAADLAWASKHGLNKVDLAQIANMGAAQGDQILRQLMSGTTSVSALNDSQALIARYTRSAATTVEDRLYAHRIAADRRDVHEQTVTLHRMERHLREIERKAGRDIASHVTITVDKNGQLKLTDEDGREIVRELRKLASKGIKP